MKHLSKIGTRQKTAFDIKRYFPIVVILVIMSLSVVTCSRRNNNPDDLIEENPAIETPAETPTQETESPPIETEPEKSPEETEEPPYDGPVNPLTGLPVESDISRNRPYAIVINNMRIAQPQLGVSKAEIIYEVPVEGGITRILAIFQDLTGVDTIGSIRSARPYLIDLASAHDAVFIHAGGSPQAYTELSNRSVTRLDGVNGSRTDIFYRDNARRQKMGYEHSMVTSGKRIAEYVPTYGFRLDHKGDYTSNLQFADETDEFLDKTANKLDVNFSGSKKTSFSYNSKEAVYELSQYGTYYTDGNNGKLLEVKNVLVLKTSVSQIAGDTEGRLKVTLTGSGSGYFVSDGKYREIEWSRNSESSQFTYKFTDGTPLRLGRGKSYICITSRDSTIYFS